MSKMQNQGTDSQNKANGVYAIGKTMRPVPSAQPKVPASKEFNGHEKKGS